MTNSLRVGLIGTGEMGRPLVDRLLGAGHRVAVFARRPEVRAELAEAGVHLVDRPSDLAAGSEVVIVYVYSDEQVRQVLIDDGVADAMETGSTIIVHTTGSPRTVEAVAARLSGRDVAVLDAPGSGGPAQVAAGTLTLFVGGDPAAVGRCQPLLGVYASQVVHFGPLGSGQKVKLLNNLLFGAQVQLALDASRLAEDFGLDATVVAKTLHTCSGASYATDLVAAMGATNLVRSAGRFIKKDVLVARDVAYDLEAQLGALDAAVEPLLDRIVD